MRMSQSVFVPDLSHTSCVTKKPPKSAQHIHTVFPSPMDLVNLSFPARAGFELRRLLTHSGSEKAEDDVRRSFKSTIRENQHQSVHRPRDGSCSGGRRAVDPENQYIPAERTGFEFPAGAMRPE